MGEIDCANGGTQWSTSNRSENGRGFFCSCFLDLLQNQAELACVGNRQTDKRPERPNARI